MMKYMRSTFHTLQYSLQKPHVYNQDISTPSTFFASPLGVVSISLNLSILRTTLEHIYTTLPSSSRSHHAWTFSNMSYKNLSYILLSFILFSRHIFHDQNFKFPIELRHITLFHFYYLMNLLWWCRVIQNSSLICHSSIPSFNALFSFYPLEVALTMFNVIVDP